MQKRCGQLAEAIASFEGWVGGGWSFPRPTRPNVMPKYRSDQSPMPNGKRPRSRAAERDSLALVLSLIRAGQAETRQEIERHSGLGRAVVADRVATLVAHNLVAEAGLAASTGGRAPRHLQFNASAGHVLVASLGSTTLGVGLADLSGGLLIEHHEPADITRGAERTVRRVMELFEWMISEYPLPGDAWAISVALPGLVGGTPDRSDEPVTLNLSLIHI